MAILLAAALAGCEGSTPPPRPKGITHVYAMRGQITSLEASPDGQIRIHHEAVSNFRDTLDQPAPMNSMTMPFEVATGVSLEGLKVDDKIAFDWEVNWDAGVHHITAIHKLPADTVLTFGPATSVPASASAPAGR